MDRRMQKTRDAIFKAFTRLLSQKPYSKITIQNILDEANIGRSTFYFHFETKDMLLNEICKEIFKHIFSDHLQVEKTHDFSIDTNDSTHIITHILYHVRDDIDNLTGIFCGESSDLFWNYMQMQFSLFMREQILSMKTEKSADIPNDLLIDHISSSFIALMKWWIQKGLSYKPEQIEQYFESLIFPIL